MNDAVIRWLNDLPPDDARQELLKCCGSRWWCERMAAARPFADGAALELEANEVFDAMPREAWLETFGSHPKIGDLDSLRMRLAGNKQWSSSEQAGVSTADEQTLVRLAEGNVAYEKRFGYVFIICATGLSAEEMLARLEQRLHNDPTMELALASEQQRKITFLRLDKLANDQGPTEGKPR